MKIFDILVSRSRREFNSNPRVIVRLSKAVKGCLKGYHSDEDTQNVS